MCGRADGAASTFMLVPTPPALAGFKVRPPKAFPGGIMTTKHPEEADRRCLKRAEVAGFTLTEGIHPAGSSLPWHRHAGPTVCFVLHGSFTEVSGGEVLACGPSTLKFMPAEERHCNRFDRAPTRGLLIEVDPSRLESIRPYCSVLDRRVHFRGGAVAGIAMRVCEELRASDDAAPLAMEGLLLELLATASRHQAPGHRGEAPAWLVDARDMIHAGLASRPSLGGLAEMVGVHPTTLARAFRRVYGCTIGVYVRRVRVERAAQQLAEGDISLVQIALTAGFTDQSHFSNVFRRHVGISPGRYRQAMSSARRRR